MPEAYEVGITLALQDGVSAGIQLIQRDLALLDRAIAATSQGLLQLQTQARSGLIGAAGQAASPDSASKERKATAVRTADSQPDSTYDSGNAAVITQAPTRAARQTTEAQDYSSVLKRKPTEAAIAAFHDGSTNGGTFTPDQVRSSPVQSNQVAGADNRATQLPSASIQAPVESRTLSYAAPSLNALTGSKSLPPRRRIGPVPPQTTDLSAAHNMSDGGDGLPDSPIRASAPIATASSDVPQKRADAGGSYRLPKGFAAYGSYDPPAPSAPIAAPDGRSASRPRAVSQSYPLIQTPQPSDKPADYAGFKVTPQPLEQSVRAPEPATRRNEDRGPASSSSAPTAATTQSVTLQGDIIIDGNRLGRWMTNSLSRQASRPPSGPIGPDPRQTPLWSGQAQGF